MNFECDMMLNSDTMDYATSTASSTISSLATRNQSSIPHQQLQHNKNHHQDSSLFNEFNNCSNSNTYDRLLSSQISRASTLVNSNSSTASLNGKDTNDDESENSIDCDNNSNSEYMLPRGSFLPSFNRNCLIANTDINNTDKASSGFLTSSNYNQDFLNSVNKFQYSLMAPTSPAVKVNEDTLTYLNQGQSYELKFNRIDLNKPALHQNRQNSTNLRKYENDDNDYKEFMKLDSNGLNLNETDNEHMYLSTVRLCFWDRKLQEVEHDEIREWEKEYNLARMLEIDNNLSFGAYDIRVSNVYTNAIEVIWNGRTGSSIFIKCNCTSTAFAKNKHGGEKGVHMRLQIDTFQITNPSVITGSKSSKPISDDGAAKNLTADAPKLDLFSENNDWWKHLCSSYCRIQLFRLKGAQRKLKTDRLKIERSNPPDLKRRYQISEPATILYNCAFDSLYSMLPLDRHELQQRQKQQLQIKQELIDPLTNASNFMPPVIDTSKQPLSSSFNSAPAFYCENDLNNSNNNAINESLQFYVENSSFALSENSKFSLMVDDISAIIDEASDENLFLGINGSLPSSRRNSLLNLLPNKPKVEQDLLTSDIYNQSNRTVFPASASLPHDLSNKQQLVASVTTATTSTAFSETKKELYSTQVSISDSRAIKTIPAAAASLSTMNSTKVSLNSPLVNDATSVYVQQWLTTNRFSHLLPIFKNYTSNDFLRLSKDDLIKLCGAPDAIRCYNLAHNIQICPRLTMFVKFNQQNYFYAIYLNECKCKYLVKRLMQFFYNGQAQKPSQSQQQIDTPTTTIANFDNQTGFNTEYENYELFIKSKGIVIKMTDEVLCNIQDETKFLVEFTRPQQDENGLFNTACDMKSKNNEQQSTELCTITHAATTHKTISITLIPLD